MSQWNCDIFQGQTLTLIIWNKGTDSFIQLINMNPLVQKRSINQQLLHGQFSHLPLLPAKGRGNVGRVSAGKWLELFYWQTLPLGRKFSMAAVLGSMLLKVSEGSWWGLPDHSVVDCRRHPCVLGKVGAKKTRAPRAPACLAICTFSLGNHLSCTFANCLELTSHWGFFWWTQIDVRSSSKLLFSSLLWLFLVPWS